MKISINLEDFNPLQLDALSALLTDVMVCQEDQEKRKGIFYMLNRIEAERLILLGEPVQNVPWWKETF